MEIVFTLLLILILAILLKINKNLENIHGELVFKDIKQIEMEDDDDEI